jgi:hypothetical protein
MLHAIDTNGWEANTAWCVPSTISFLTGVPLIHSHSRAAFIQDKGIKEVKGVYASEALLMLREQGYMTELIKLSDKYSEPPRLRRFLDERSSYEMCMPLMIQIEDSKKFCHMICAHFNFAADNHTMKPVPIHQFPHLKKYVTAAWIVHKKR